MARSRKLKDDRPGALRSLGLFGPAFLITIVGFVLTYQFVEPAPSRNVTIATGSREGAYFGFGERYRQFLATHGVSLNVRESAGTLENVALLRDRGSGVDIAFVQGGVASDDGTSLLALASLYYEPLWLFSQADSPIQRIPDLRGKRFAVGQEGSGTRALVR